MNVFLVVFFPLMYFLLNGLKSIDFKFFYENSIKSFLLAVFVSFVYCFVDLFVTSIYKQVPDNFILNLISFYLFDFFIPFAFGFLLIIIASRKTMYHKVLTILPFFLGFYSIFIPYNCLFEYEVTDMFLLFVKPTIYFSMIFSVWVLIYLFSKAVKSHASVGYKILFIFLAVLISLIPATLETLNFLKMFFHIKLGLMILLYLFTIVLFFVFINKSKSEEIV